MSERSAGRIADFKKGVDCSLNVRSSTRFSLDALAQIRDLLPPLSLRRIRIEWGGLVQNSFQDSESPASQFYVPALKGFQQGREDRGAALDQLASCGDVLIA